MNSQGMAEKHPYAFSVLLLVLFFVVNAVGVFLAARAGLQPTSYALYTELALVVILAVIVVWLGWWVEIGLRRPRTAAALLLYLPALVILLGNLTFGIHVQNLPDLVNYFVLACASGFVEELVFRGLMLRAFLPRGGWTAVLVTAFLFGMAHAANALAGSNLLYVVVQIAYALPLALGLRPCACLGGCSGR
jgi:membrane protease YdiL (CAAX protease family)